MTLQNGCAIISKRLRKHLCEPDDRYHGTFQVKLNKHPPGRFQIRESGRKKGFLSKAEKMHEIVIVGSLNMDLVVQVKEMPLPGETIPGSDLQTICGGKGANQAVAAGRIAGSAAMVGRVGKEAFGTRLLESLDNAHVDTAFVGRDDTPTGTAVILVDSHGENSIVISPGANGQVTEADLDAAGSLLKNARFVLTQFELPMQVTQSLIERMQKYAGKLILNPAPYRPIDPEFLAKVDYFVPNETEAEKFTGVHITDMDSAQKACRVLLDMGIQNVVMTLGAKGALLANRDGMWPIPGIAVKPVDTTAAGDTFIGAFAAALVRQFSLEDAVRYANCAAAIAVTRFGAQTSIPSAEEVDALLAGQKNW